MIALLAPTLAAGGSTLAANYNPLAVDSTFSPARFEATVHDSARNRDIPLLVYLPKSTSPAPVVLFSHGLGGSREGSRFLGEHWAGRGYVAVFVQHPGSDSSVLKSAGPRDWMRSLKEAASLRNFVERTGDIPAVLNQLERWNTEKGHPLAGRMDLKKIGMSGHSFGAIPPRPSAVKPFPGRDKSSRTRASKPPSLSVQAPPPAAARSGPLDR